MAELGVREVSGVQIADMKKTVLAHAEVDKSRLYPGLDIDHSPLVNIADVAAQARAFHIKLLKRALFDDRHPALFSFGYIDEHFS